MKCLTATDWERYHADELSPEQREAIAAHLDACPQCQQAGEAVRQQHDRMIERLRSAGRPPQRTTSTSRPNPPPQLPGYEIRGEINRGGQGIVYRAWQQSTQRDVAIKVLRDGVDASPSAQRRFEREVELVAGLRHPGVVQIFDSGQMDDGRRYIVMDYVEGLPLLRYANENNCDLGQRLQLFSALCDAVHHAHQRGVIHRDLKPSNILVRPDGQPCVLDFGLARQLQDAADRRQTMTGHVAGTLAYLSPEQARGLPDAIDVRSDVYTLGVLLFELVCGRMPYAVDGDTVEALQAIAEQSPRGPLTLADDDGLPGGRVPNDLETILRTALAKDRARRYQAADALAADVRSFESGDAIAARRDSSWYLLQILVRRYRTVFALASVLLLVSVGSAVGLAWLYAEQSAQRARAEAAQRVADERFQRLRQLANGVMFGLDPKLRRVPGTAEARAFVVTTALAYLDGLMAETPEDDELLYELARGYSTMAEVLGDVNSSTVDDLPEALRRIETARRLCEQLRVRQPDHTNPKRLLQRIWTQKGDILGNLGKRDQARDAYEEALRLAQAMTEGGVLEGPDHEMLANTYERLGNIRMAFDDYEGARVAYEASLRHGDQYLAANPGDLWAQRGQGVSQTKLARLAVQAGDPAEALRFYRLFRVGAVARAATAPNNLVLQRDLATAEEWHCILLTQLGDAAGALPYCEASVAISDRLLQREPEARKTREALAGKLTKLVETQLQLEEWDAALATIERLQDVAGALVADSTDRGAALRLLGVSRYKLFEYHKQRSASRGRSREEQLVAFRQAEEALLACQQTFEQAEAEGVLAAGDRGVVTQLKLERQLLQMSQQALE